MENTSAYFKYQYDLILGARASLLNYCATISNEDFLNQKSAFELGGSIRNLLVHIANTYQSWIIQRALHREINFTEYSAITSIKEVESLFHSIDSEVIVGSSTGAPVGSLKLCFQHLPLRT